MQEMTQALLVTLNGIDSLVRSPQLYSSFADLSRSLQESVKLMRKIEKQIDPVSGGLVSTTDEANKTLNRVEDLLIEIQRRMATDRYEMHTALRQFAEANRSLRLLAEHLQENPSSLIFGKD